jgi:hypothetical protein
MILVKLYTISKPDTGNKYHALAILDKTYFNNPALILKKKFDI